jgi:hypothetical protein
VSGSAQPNFSALANQVRNGGMITLNPTAAKAGPQPAAVDYSALADEARGVEAPSPFGQFLSEYGAKINPVTQAQGVVSAVTHPGPAIQGYRSQNADLLKRAEDSWKSGDYVGAAVHGLNYMLNGVPGIGAALDEAGNKFRAGDPAGGLADTAGLATNLYVGAKAPAIAQGVAKGASAVKAAATGAVAADPAVALARAGILPKGSAYLDNPETLPTAMADIKASGLIGGNNSLRSAAASALNKNSAALETNFLAPARTAGAKAVGAPIVQATADAIPETLQRENPAQAKSLLDTATKAYGGDLTTDQLHQLLIEKNALLKSFFDKSPAAQQAAATSGIPEAVVKAQRDAIAKTLYETLDPQNGGDGPREIQARHGAIQEIAAEAEKRNLAIVAEKPVSKGGAFTSRLAAIADVPGKILQGKTEEAISGVTKPFSGVSDPLIRRAFQGVGPAKPYPSGSSGSSISGPVQSTAPGAAPNVTITPGARNARQAAPQVDPGTTVDAGRTGEGAPDSEPDRPGGEASSSAPGGPGAGNATSVRIPGQPNRYPAQYEVRELADVQASHSGRNFQPNPKYGIRNDRDYSQQENQGKVVNWSTRAQFDPEYALTESPTASDGAPVIDDAGNVLGGNGRTMILDRVYGSNPQGAVAYKKLLTLKASQFGIDPTQIEAMKQPVLVRRIGDEDLAAQGGKQQAVTDFNKVGTAALKPSEKALADSRRVSQETLDNIASRLDAKGTDATLMGVLDGNAGPEVLNSLIADGVISPQESAAYINGKELTAEGKARVSKLMLGRFFRDPAQLDATPASIRNKLEQIAAPLAKTEGKGEWSLTEPMHSAMDLLEEARAHGQKNLDDMISQSSLLGDQTYSPQAVRLAKSLQNLNQNDLKDAVRQYSQDAADSGKGAGLFGDPPTQKESFDAAFNPLAVAARRAAKLTRDNKLKLPPKK